MKKSQHNVFLLFLDLLGVKYTRNEADKLYTEHPHRDNLYGLSDMLSIYGIENTSLRLEKNIGILGEIETPFIAHAGNDFVLVHQIAPNSISYYWREKYITISKEEFLKIWSGIVLIAEANENSVEPNYKSNLYKELLHTGKKLALTIAIITAIVLIAIYTGIHLNIGLLLVIFINSVGIYISYLLLLKQMHIRNASADKICSLFLKQGDCNNILESKAAKFLQIFSWSEIGLSYFTANLLIALYLPILYPFVAIINILVLPYTIWSIWYQAKIAKQWCILCVAVQVLLWLIFIVNVAFGFNILPAITIPNVLLTGCFYIIPLLIVNLLVPYFMDSQKLQQTTQHLNNLKADEKIFLALLMQQPRHKINMSVGLLWGNLNSKHTITVITNPHCNPCADMHKRLKKLLHKTNNGYCIQYILTAFNEEFEISNQLFISMYKQMKEKDFLYFLDEWYTDRKNNYKKVYTKYVFDSDDEHLTKEFALQKQWLNQTSIRATPTVLYDGYELPKKYVVENLEFFYK